MGCRDGFRRVRLSGRGLSGGRMMVVVMMLRVLAAVFAEKGSPNQQD
jgi:hypothetical protein